MLPVRQKHSPHKNTTAPITAPAMQEVVAAKKHAAYTAKIRYLFLLCMHQGEGGIRLKDPAPPAV